MVYFNQTVKDKLDKLRQGNFYVLSDFDHTLSVGVGTFDIPKMLPHMPKSIVERGNEISARYIELIKRYHLNNEKDLEFEIINWWHEELDLFREYKIKLSEIKTYMQNNDAILLRDGTAAFLKTLNDKNVPVVILSAGIKEILDMVLDKYGCNYENVDVVSNLLKLNNDVLDGVQGEVITSFNKYEERLSSEILKKIEGKFPVLMGDQLTDISMLPVSKQEDALKIGFLNDKHEDTQEQLEIFKKHFDIVCNSDCSITELLNELTYQHNFNF